MYNNKKCILTLYRDVIVTKDFFLVLDKTIWCKYYVTHSIKMFVFILDNYFTFIKTVSMATMHIKFMQKNQKNQQRVPIGIK